MCLIIRLVGSCEVVGIGLCVGIGGSLIGGGLMCCLCIGGEKGMVVF